MTDTDHARTGTARRARDNDARALPELLLEGAPDALVGFDRDGLIRVVNRRTEVVFGYDREELIGRPVEMLVPRLLRGIHQTQRERYVADRRSRAVSGDADLTGRCRDGTEFPVEINLAGVDDADGPLFIAAVRDVTDRGITPPTYRRLAAVLEYAGDAILTETVDGMITSWSRGAEHLYGHREGDVLGRSSSLLAPPGHGDELAEMLDEVLSDGRVVRRETTLVRKDGTTVAVALTMSPVLDANGEVGEIAVIGADITQRLRAEDGLAERTRQLERENAELAQFAYVAAHDLQEPLRKVASFCTLLARRYEGQLDEQADLYISYAVDGATRMQQLVNDLLMFCRMGQQQEETVEVDCNLVLQQVRRDLAAAIEESGATVVVAGTLPTVRGEETRLTQLFENLIANAVKFRGPEAPRVVVSAVRDGAEWRFSVADNGIGIESRYADRIFAVFQRLHARAEYPGTGIGLALCKKIVEGYGGKIWFESRLGEGTTFSWTLPADP
jgi:PAS domain S-box-containing protein